MNKCRLSSTDGHILLRLNDQDREMVYFSMSVTRLGAGLPDWYTSNSDKAHHVCKKKKTPPATPSPTQVDDIDDPNLSTSD